MVSLDPILGNSLNLDPILKFKYVENFSEERSGLDLKQQVPAASKTSKVSRLKRQAEDN